MAISPRFNVIWDSFPQEDNTWLNTATTFDDPDFAEDGTNPSIRKTQTNVSISSLQSLQQTPAVNISAATHIIVDYYIRDFVATTNTAEENQKLWNQFRVLLGDNALAAYRTITQARGYGNSDILFRASQPGRQRAIFNIANGVNTGAYDNTAFEKMRIDFQAYDATPASAPADIDWVLLRVRIGTLVDEPRIFLTHDDGYDHFVPYAEAAAALGVPMTLYVLTSKIDTAGYLTLSELNDIQAMGHLIASHGHVHDSRFTLSGTQDFAAPQSKEYVKANMKAARDWLIDNGFERGAYLYATPYTEYDRVTLEAAFEGPDPICHQMANGIIPYSGDWNHTHEADITDAKNWPYYTGSQVVRRFNSDVYGTNFVTWATTHSQSIVGFTHAQYSGAQVTLVNAVAAAQASGTIRCCTMDELAYGLLDSGGSGSRTGLRGAELR